MAGVARADERLFALFCAPIPRPSLVAESSSAGRNGRAKQSQMLASSKIGKHRFSTRIRTFRCHQTSVKKHVFCETKPNENKREPAPTDCNSGTCMKTLWRRLTMPGAKRTQMKPWEERSRRATVATEPSPPETRETRVAETVRVRGCGDCMVEAEPHPQTSRSDATAWAARAKRNLTLHASRSTLCLS